ncbi:MAG: ABC1 kinase family protein [Gemmataceae bacterium]
MRRQLIPTTLVDHRSRAPIPLIRPQGLPRFRGVLLFWSLFKLLAVLGWLRLRGKLTSESAGRRVRTLLEQLGFLWVKLGQILSLQTDVFSSEFCNELSKLQYQVRGFPFELARRTVEEAIGGPIDRIFGEFDESPFAAASISQVHRAVLRNSGVLVVVKVQRPDVPVIFSSDMNLLRALIRMIRRLGGPFQRWEEVQEELAQTVREEIDYRYEISNLRRMRKSLRAHRIYVPKVFEDLSSPRVLVMEFVQGTLMSDFISLRRTEPERVSVWLEENGISAKKVGQRVYLSFLRQLFEDNLLHGDLHPGNIILLRNSNFAFIDLGTIGTLEVQLLQNYARHLQALAAHQYDRAADLNLLGCSDLPAVDLVEVKQKLVRCYQEWDESCARRDVPYSERSMEKLGTKSNQVLIEKNLIISLQYLKIGRTLATMDASLATLIPDAKYSRLMRQYFKSAQKRARQGNRQRRIQRSARQIYESLAEGSELARTMLGRGGLSFRGETTKFHFCIGTICHGLHAGVALMIVGWCLFMLELRFPSGLPLQPVSDLIRYFTGNDPGPQETWWQYFLFFALVGIWLWLRKLERWWLQHEYRLPK